MRLESCSNEIAEREVDVGGSIVLFLFLLLLFMPFLLIGNFLYEEVMNSVHIPDEFINSLKKGWNQPAIRPFRGKINWVPTIIASILGIVVWVPTFKREKGIKEGLIVAAFILVVFGVSVGGPRLQHNINEKQRLPQSPLEIVEGHIRNEEVSWLYDNLGKYVKEKDHMIVPYVMLQVLEKRGGPYKETNEKYYKIYCGLLNEAQKDQNLKHSFRPDVIKEIGEACNAFYSGN